MEKDHTSEMNERKINSLLQLVDDPDEEVYESVAREFISLGQTVVEPLEHLWEVTEDVLIQKRIEEIIHSVQLESLIREWKEWYVQKGSLLQAMILLAKYKYPALQAEAIHKQYAKLKQDIWLELNQYLTPLEQINVVNGIVYSFYNFSGTEIYKSEENHFYINKLFDTKKGNSYSIGMLISSILNELDVPLKCIQLPHQFLLGYYEIVQPFYKAGSEEVIMKLSCYVDPNNGYVFSQRDIDTYFKKIGEEAKKEYFLPLGNDQLALVMLKELQYLLEQKGDYAASEDILSIIRETFGDE